ncbi:MAG: Ig-like domain-containing protein [Gemmatimonadota bacterium]
MNHDGSSSRARRAVAAAHALRRTLRSVLVMATLAVVTSCGGDTDPVLPPLSLDSETAAIEVGETYQLSARNARGDVTWSTSNASVASVASTGFVTATGIGTARITARTATDSAGATITVRAPRVIALSTANLSVGAPAVTGGTVVRDVNVTNAGPGTITGLNVTEIRYPDGIGTPWLTAQLLSASATTSQAAVLRISAAVAGLAPGAYSAMVIIGADATSIVPASVTITFTVGDAPTIELSATSASFSATSGGADPAAQRITVRSGTAAQATGLSTAITYNEPAQTGWLTATLDSTGTTTGLTLQAAPGTRPAGTYTASVRIAAANTEIAARTVLVTFTIAAQPTIVISSATATFSAAAGGANPAAQPISITNGAGGTLSGLGTSIAYTSGTGWLSATLNTTTAPATLTLQPTTGALAVGTYTATVSVASAVAGNSPRTVAVTFTVSAGPVIAVTPTSLTFASLTTASPASQTVAVSNGGGGTLTGLSAAVEYVSGSGWLTASLNTTAAPATLTVQPAVGSLAVGTYTANVRLSSSVAGVASVLVPVTYNVTAGPSIVLSATTRTFAAVVGSADPVAQTVTITNGGGGTLSSLTTSIAYGAGGSGWLSASLNSTTAPSTLTLTVARGGLTTGSYTATVNVASSVATNSPRTVTVILNVTAPAIALSATTRSATIGQGNGTVTSPTIPTIAITNSGDGSLSGLTATVTYLTGPELSGWLTGATLNTTTAPATLTISMNAGAPGSLRPTGTYTARIRIQSSVASNSPQDITVQMVVGLSLANSGVYSALVASSGAGGGGCANSGCHSAGSTSPDLSSATNFRNNMLNIATVSRALYPLATTHPTRIVAGSASTSYLTYQLSSTSGALAMPAGVATRTLVTNWINDGALP